MTTQTPPRKLAPPTRSLKISGPAKARGITLYGPHGVGKTTLLGTLEGRGLILDVAAWEDGSHVLEDKWDHIDCHAIDTWKDTDDWEAYLKQGTKVHGYDWVAIDTFTALQDIAKRRAINERPHGVNADPHNLSPAEWGKVNQFLTEFLYQYNQLPMLKIYVCQEERYLIANIEPFIGPATRDKLVDLLIEPMSIVGRLTKVKGTDTRDEWRLLIDELPPYKAKYRVSIDKSPLLPHTLVNPNLGELLKFCYGNGAPPRGIDDQYSSAAALSDEEV